MSDTTKSDLAAGQSRATAWTSTGPKSAEGKAHSSPLAPTSHVEARIAQQLPGKHFSANRPPATRNPLIPLRPKAK